MAYVSKHRKKIVTFLVSFMLGCLVHANEEQEKIIENVLPLFLIGMHDRSTTHERGPIVSFYVPKGTPLQLCYDFASQKYNVNPAVGALDYYFISDPSPKEIKVGHIPIPAPHEKLSSQLRHDPEGKQKRRRYVKKHLTSNNDITTANIEHVTFYQLKKRKLKDYTLTGRDCAITMQDKAITLLDPASNQLVIMTEEEKQTLLDRTHPLVIAYQYNMTGYLPYYKVLLNCESVTASTSQTKLIAMWVPEQVALKKVLTFIHERYGFTKILETHIVSRQNQGKVHTLTEAQVIETDNQEKKIKELAKQIIPTDASQVIASTHLNNHQLDKQDLHDNPIRNNENLQINDIPILVLDTGTQKLALITQEEKDSIIAKITTTGAPPLPTPIPHESIGSSNSRNTGIWGRLFEQNNQQIGQADHQQTNDVINGVNQQNNQNVNWVNNDWLNQLNTQRATQGNNQQTNNNTMQEIKNYIIPRLLFLFILVGGIYLVSKRNRGKKILRSYVKKGK